jgi:serine/threonine protein kinase
VVSDKPSVDSIFLAAVELPSDQRPAFLDEACGDDAALRARVERLLAAQSQNESFLESPAPELGATGERPIAEAPGDAIGPYKLLQQIGEGGFGVVFLAEQERPVRRRVALKVIKPGMDTRAVVGRFEAERQALAIMAHPHIAKVLDAGTTENGRPYFVMELVQGVPITDYCDQSNLATRERLELFVTVCQAVQHAHQNGIIHRDIKPTNVLVAIQDGKPTPKIIDFGVAKAIGEHSLTERTLTTAFAQMIGTPMYMSPEQAELSPLGVDTRSDIYSLGVMLYELLTGTTPFDKDRLHEASYDELRRIIREEEPPRPSARVSTLAADLATTVAERRRTDARRLGQQVRGELDWIVMKCLEKDRNRRYESAGGLARDVERYLHDEPVQACPPSAAYRLRKFIRRNKIAAAFVLLLVAATAALTLSNVQTRISERRAITENAKAQAVSNLLQEMLRSANPEAAKDAEYTVRQLLDEFSANFAAGLPDQPEVEAEIRATIGRAYSRLGVGDKSEPQLTKALELRRRIYGPDDERVAEVLVDMAWCHKEQTHLPEAEDAAREAVRIYRASGTTGVPIFQAAAVLQRVLISTQQFDEAQAVAEEALAQARASGAEYPDIAVILHGQADLYVQLGRFPDAEIVARKAVDMHRRLHGPNHPETGWGLRTLGRALLLQQKLPEAESAFREALAIFRRQYTVGHRTVDGTLSDLAEVFTAQGDAAAIEALASEQRELASRSENAANDVHLAGLLMTDNPLPGARKAAARRLIRRAMDDYGRMAAEAPRDQKRRLEAVDGYWAVAKLCLTDPDEFAPEIDDAYRRRTEELERLLAEFPDSVSLQNDAAYKYRAWAFLVQRISRFAPQREDALRQSIVHFENVARKDPKMPGVWFFLATSCVNVGDLTWASAKPEDAKAAFQRAMEIYDEHRAETESESDPNSTADIVRLYSCIAYYLSATDRAQQAADYVRRASDNANRLTDPTSLADSLYFVALMQARLGDTAGYRATCKKMVGLPFSEILPSVVKGRLLVTLCLLPGALEDPRVPVKLAEERLAKNPPKEPSAGPNLLGTALYRAGQFDKAANQLEDALELYPSDASRSNYSINSLRLRLAMTKWQLGQQDAARQQLAEALPSLEAELQSPTTMWNRRAFLELQRDEATALIEQADEAVENQGTNDE